MTTMYVGTSKVQRFTQNTVGIELNLANAECVHLVLKYNGSGVTDHECSQISLLVADCLKYGEINVTFDSHNGKVNLFTSNIDSEIKKYTPSSNCMYIKSDKFSDTITNIIIERNNICSVYVNTTPPKCPCYGTGAVFCDSCNDMFC